MQICKAAGDPLRAGVLQLLANDSFGVLELCDIFDMAQPAMSHHLKCLAEAGLVDKRPEGTHVFYQRSSRPDALVNALFNALDQESVPAATRTGTQRVYQARAARSLRFFEDHADALQQQRALVCQSEVYAQAVLNALQQLPSEQRNSVLEVGPGDGLLLIELAQLFAKVDGIDTSNATLASARQATSRLQNVALDHADFFSQPAQQAYNALVAAMVIHHLASPEQFFHHAAAHLCGGGLLIVAELSAHQQQWVTDACGDVWLGFTPEQLIHWGETAGFHPVQQQHLAQRNGFNVQVHTFQRDS